MGNSQAAPTEEVVVDSRVIKITESLAKKLFTSPSGAKSTSVAIPDSTIPRQYQAYRADGNYVDEALFHEFQKQEVMNELQIRAMYRNISSASETFLGKRPAAEPFADSKEQKQVLGCLKSHPKEPLKCHQEALDFTNYLEDFTTTKKPQP